jgi:hypothetical protein
MRRQRLPYAAALIIVIILGLSARAFLPRVWPWFSKEAGDVLYAVAAYFLIVLLFPNLSVGRAAATALLYSCAVEAFKLVRAPSLDAFRHTLPGRLVLGAVFSWGDIACYFVGVALAALIDRTIDRLSARHRV